MSSPPDTYDLAELAATAGVTPRTVRYYVQQGLLPSPSTRGPGTRYEQAHLDRLQLIKQLQRQHLPLAEIRRRLEALDDQEVRDLVQAPPPEPPRTSALEYVRDVLASHPASAPAPAPGPAPAFVARVMAAMSPAGPGSVEGGTSQSSRSQWDRISLAPDVELHVRRPLSREQNRRVERLLDAARVIFEEGS